MTMMKDPFYNFDDNYNDDNILFLWQSSDIITFNILYKAFSDFYEQKSGKEIKYIKLMLSWSKKKEKKKNVQIKIGACKKYK